MIFGYNETMMTGQTQQPDPYDTPDIEGEIDTVYEAVEFIEKKKKIPVFIWIIMIILVSLITLALTSNQSPTLQF